MEMHFLASESNDIQNRPLKDWTNCIVDISYSIKQPHPKLPSPAELDDKEADLVKIASYLRAYAKTTPCYISAGKKRDYIERFQDRYTAPAPKMPLYTYIDPFIQLLPEELVTGKAKRRWIASKRAKDADHPDGAELFGDSEEEEGEEGSQKGEDDELLEGDENNELDDEMEYEVFSDDEAMDEDDGPDGTWSRVQYLFESQCGFTSGSTDCWRLLINRNQQKSRVVFWETKVSILTSTVLMC
jgi:hypothetical protein